MQARYKHDDNEKISGWESSFLRADSGMEPLGENADISMIKPRILMQPPV
jgi:hypothetical protein